MSYVSARFSPESAAELHEFAETLGLPNIVPAKDMHVTVFASQTALPDGIISTTDVEYCCRGRTLKYFGCRHQMLALVLHTPELCRINSLISATSGIKHKHGDYIAHVTLTYDVNTWCGHINTDVPLMDIRKIVVEPFNDDWTSGTNPG